MIRETPANREEKRNKEMKKERNKQREQLPRINIELIKNPTGITYKEKLKTIEQEEEKANKLYELLTKALLKGEITLGEHDYALKKLAGGLRENELRKLITEKKAEIIAEHRIKINSIKKRTKEYAYITVLIIIAIIGLTYLKGVTTGYATYIDKITTINENIILNNTINSTNTTLENITGLKISGTLKGTKATIEAYSEREKGWLTITTIEKKPYERTENPEITTDKSEYQPGEPIIISITNAEPEVTTSQTSSTNTTINTTNNNSTNTNDTTSTSENNTTTTATPTRTYTLYLKNPEGEVRPLFTNNITINQTGIYEIYALITETDGTITKESTTIKITDPEEPITFTDECNQTCTLTNDNITRIRVTNTDGTTTITTITIITLAENNPPTQTRTIPDYELTTNMTITVNLSNYFTDPDGQTLIYDISPGTNARIEGDKMIISNNNPSTTTEKIYATDGQEMITSNEFTIRIISPDDNRTTNRTITDNNNTSTVVNTTNNTSTTSNNETTTITTTTTSSSCDDPDPNKRDPSCLLENPEKYFQEQTIIITTKDRKPTARITNIGNILIKGDLIENAGTINPDENDYTIGYVDEYGRYIPTIWFNNDNGNLYLKGELYEEETELSPPPGSYVLKNKKGIILAWADTKRGDLHIRGNLVPYRRKIE